MSNLTQAAKAAMFAPQTDEIFLELLTINSGQYRFVNNTEPITSRSNVFTPFPFSVVLPPDRANEAVSARLVIDVIDQTIVSALRAATTPPQMMVEIILASDPDNVQAGPYNFTWRIANWDDKQISGDIRFEELLWEPFPADKFTPAKFPAVF